MFMLSCVYVAQLYSEDALISVIFGTIKKTFSDDNSPQKDQRVIHEPVFDQQLEGNIPSFS